jgi:hypothetical protein
MKKRDSASNVSRRGLLKGATVAGVATVGATFEAEAQAPVQPLGQSRPAGPTTPPPNPAAERGDPQIDVIQGPSGSDYMADVIKSLGIEHVASNPGNLFRGLHESLVNYLKIDWHTCTHEEASVAMATGYAKIEGKPILTLAHGTVGPAACLDGALQCVVRPGAGLHDGRQYGRCGEARPRRRVGPFGAGRRRDGARLRQMGRSRLEREEAERRAAMPVPANSDWGEQWEKETAARAARARP